MNQDIVIFLKKGKGKNDLSCVRMYEIRNVIKHKFVAARNDNAFSFNSSKGLSLTFVVFIISLANIAAYKINKFTLLKNPWHLQKQEEHPQEANITTYIHHNLSFFAQLLSCLVTIICLCSVAQLLLQFLLILSFFLNGCTICLCSIVATVPPLLATVFPACVVATANGVKTSALSCAGSTGSNLIC